MSDEDLEAARKAGREMGRLVTMVEGLVSRVARIEKAWLGVVGAIVAAWAKSKGLW